jgi:hypothetical protein
VIKPPVLPDAGLSLAWRKITAADFDEKVEPHLLEVGDADEQINYLLTLKADCEYERDKIFRQIQEEEQRTLDWGLYGFYGPGCGSVFLPRAAL